MDFTTWSLVRLRALCKERGLCGYTSKKKAELLDILKGVSEEDVERSATEWFGKEPSLMRSWFVQAVSDPMQHRDIGKVLAYATELHVNRVLSEQSGRSIQAVFGKSYDGETTDPGPKVRHQIKFRSTGSWHLETTRRNSTKNKAYNDTGHVVYRKEEFDLLVIFIPGKAFGLTGSKLRCIPVSDLIDPQKPHQLRTNLNPLKKVFDKDDISLQVVRTIYQ